MSAAGGTVEDTMSRYGTMTGTARRRWAADGALAALAVGVDVAGAFVPDHRAGETGWSHPGAFGVVLLVIGGLALLARRPYPVTTLAVVLGTTLLAGAIDTGNFWLAMIIAFFSAVLRGKRLAAIASLVIGYGVSVIHASTVFRLALLVGLLVLLLAAEIARARIARAAAARRAADERAQRRASEERLAIARDLHDVVAHSISVINVQATMALHLMDRQPERARESLTAIREVSGQALAELGTVLGALRGGTSDGGAADGRAPLAPVPGIARLDELTARARAAGFTVSLASEGQVRSLPAGVDGAAYRIVQESLTNAVRHSGGTSASVLLRYGPDQLEIEVTDDGGGGHGDTGGQGDVRGHHRGLGNGLSGMSERATALGGSFEAGPRPGGGFGVLARLPLPELPAEAAADMFGQPA
jgi:signal transduction histidine kinase